MTKYGNFGFKQGVLLVVRLFVTFVVMLVAFIASAKVIMTGVETSPAEATQSGLAFLIVSLINSLVLAYLILRSRWTGVQLIAAIFVVHFGVETFMAQIETLYFNNAIAMPMDTVFRIMGTGLVRALIFAPLAVLVLGKFKGTALADKSPQMPTPEWIRRFAVLAIVYAIVYLVFGYFVAWQWAEVRQFYTGSTAIQPFLTQISSDPILPLFQILRGVMWAGLGLLIVKMVKGKTLETCLVVAVAFAVLITSGLIFPNPFMPPAVRQAHFIEVGSSMLIYGAIVGWVWTRNTNANKE